MACNFWNLPQGCDALVLHSTGKSEGSLQTHPQMGEGSFQTRPLARGEREATYRAPLV